MASDDAPPPEIDIEAIDTQPAKRRWTKEEDKALKRLVKEAPTRVGRRRPPDYMAPMVPDWLWISARMPGRNFEQCYGRWNQSLQPNIKHGRWTPEEDEHLAYYFGKYGYNWKLISSKIEGRTNVQCYSRWSTKLNPDLPPKNREGGSGFWTSDEDKRVRELFDEHGANWGLIEKHIPGRTRQDIVKHWRIVLNPSVSKALWSKKEDKKLLRLHAVYGDKWAFIARQLPGREGSHVSARWKHSVDPTLRKDPWTDAEDLKMTRLYAVHGGKWSRIAEGITGRNDSQVQCYWKGLEKRMGDAWTEAEDEMLLEKRAEHSQDW